MSRWQPDARGRLARAALDLYEEHGFDQTTTAQIAERAGVTERTYFRHFADKREVLFDGSSLLEDRLAEGIGQPPATETPFAVAREAFARMASALEDRGDFARRRAAVVAATPRLQERELLKLTTLRDAAAAALGLRDVPEPTASMLAEVGVAAFRVGFEAWVSGGHGRPIADEVRAAFDAIRDAVA